MARRGDSVIGIDLGKRVLKGVALRRRSDSRFVLTNFTSLKLEKDISDTDELAQHLKSLAKELGASGKGCAIAVSDPASFLRIIEQPNTPVDLLRNALRLNGLAVLNQECKDYILDVTPVLAGSSGDESNNQTEDGKESGAVAVQASVGTKTKYLVGGILRSVVKQIVEAAEKAKISPDTLQLAPACSFNAFELAYPEIFHNEAFLLLDMGHAQSTVLMGSKGELVLVRSIDYGGKHLSQVLTANGAVDEHAAWTMVHEGDAGMKEICHSSVVRLATEVRNSIGFFEGQREESIQRIFVSGGLARAEAVLQTLSDELGLPCEIWDPLETCEVSLPAEKRSALPHEFVSLNVACGAALEYLNQ